MDKASEVKEHIKSLLKELIFLESSRHTIREELLDQTIYLLELYIKQEVDSYINSRKEE